MNPEEAPKTPPEAEMPPAHPPAPPDKPKSKSRPVKVYLTVLFCVALLLLLISFVMQQRNHLALQDLNDSISNTQEIADLQLENQRLQYELEDKQALEEQVQAQQKQVEAFEETGLESSLPTESVVEGADSPADTYRSIYAMLF